MVNLKNIVKGEGAFIYGFVYMIIMTYLIIPIIDVGNSILTTTNEVEAVSWLLVLTFYLFVSIIIPANWIYMGITEKQEKEPNKFMLSIVAIFMFIIGVFLTVKGWYMITSMHNVIIGSGFSEGVTVVLSAFFWVGLIISWILSVIIAPVCILVSTRNSGQLIQ